MNKIKYVMKKGPSTLTATKPSRFFRLPRHISATAVTPTAVNGFQHFAASFAAFVHVAQPVEFEDASVAASAVVPPPPVAGIFAKSANPLTMPYTLVDSIMSNTTTHCAIISAIAALHPALARGPSATPHIPAKSSCPPRAPYRSTSVAVYAIAHVITTALAAPSANPLSVNAHGTASTALPTIVFHSAKIVAKSPADARASSLASSSSSSPSLATSRSGRSTSSSRGTARSTSSGAIASRCLDVF